MTEESKHTKPARKRNPLKTILKTIGWILLAVIFLVTVAITVAVNYLKPERLTPLVERIANDNIRGQLSVGRIEISFYSTFPRFELDVRDLTLLTHAFAPLPDSIVRRIPANADSLLSIKRFNGAIDIPALLIGKFHLYDTEISSPRLNLVQATPDVWSLDIFPPSDDVDDEDDTPLFIPDFELGTFTITDGFPIAYTSLPDSINASLHLSTIGISGNNAPTYRLDIAGLSSLSIPDLTVDSMSFGIGGDIIWNPDTPLLVGLKKFGLRAGKVSTQLSTTINLTDNLTLETLEATLPSTPFNNIISLIPTDFRGELDKVKTDLSISAALNLLKPYAVGVDSIPSFDLAVEIPKGSLRYDGMSLDIFQLDAKASIHGDDLDRSSLSVRKLRAQGEGMGFSLTADVTRPVSNPAIKGTFKGGLSFARLPAILLKEFPGTIKGLLKADCDFNLRAGWLNRENFHRIQLKGDATLTGLDLDMPDVPLSLYSKEMELRFGTNTSFTRMDATADSLLTASLRIDTVSCLMPGMQLRGRGLRMGVGTRNTGPSADTTSINPIGGRIVAEWLMLRSDETDSMRVRLRNATIGASITRYKGDSRKPLMHLDIGAERAIYGDRLNRALLRETGVSVNVHPAAPPKLSPRRQAHLDSILAALPDISPDSARRMEARIYYQRRRRFSTADTTGHELVDMEIDNSMKKLLLLWRAEGRLKATDMRLFTPLFPLRNRISDLDVKFNSDSVIIAGTRIHTGASDLTVNGTISNLTRALTSTSGRQSLVANLNISSDTLDINQISGAVFAGAAFAEKDDGLSSLSSSDEDTDDEKTIDKTMAEAAADTMTVLVVPYNIEANLDIKARNIIYSNLTFHDFSGLLSIYRGAINLNRLTARTDVGSIGLNALYSAPDKHDVSFAFGLNVNDFRIGEFLKLVPAIDTVMPLLQSIDGIIHADIAATTGIDSAMNLDIPTLKAAVKISGDSLKVTDDETFRTIGKWLLFKHKERNIIDSMNVEMIVENSTLRLFPFMFNLDRYKLGVMGSNDMNMNFNYHVAVLKSPIPFRFGVNISGNPDKMKIRLGGAKFNEKSMPRSVSIADTTRINLVNEIRNVFRRGVRNARVKGLDFAGQRPPAANPDSSSDTISRSDSLYFIKEGLIEAPDTTQLK